MIRRVVVISLLLLVAGPLSAQRATQVPVSANVRLTFHLIQADGFTEDDPEIRPIVVELRKLFRFHGYRLASKSLLQAVTYETVRQRITDPEGQSYMIEANVSGEGVRVSTNVPPLQTERRPINLRVKLYLPPFPPFPTTNSTQNVLIDASVSLTDGKTAVLGSAQNNAASKAVILTVTPVINP